jgi:hypothetical protein
MHTANFINRAAPGVLHPAMETRASAASGGNALEVRCHYDGALLVASLEELLAKRQTIEWLVESELLWRCMP